MWMKGNLITLNDTRFHTPGRTCKNIARTCDTMSQRAGMLIPIQRAGMLIPIQRTRCGSMQAE